MSCILRLTTRPRKDFVQGLYNSRVASVPADVPLFTFIRCERTSSSIACKSFTSGGESGNFNFMWTSASPRNNAEIFICCFALLKLSTVTKPLRCWWARRLTKGTAWYFFWWCSSLHLVNLASKFYLEFSASSSPAFICLAYRGHARNCREPFAGTEFDFEVFQPCVLPPFVMLHCVRLAVPSATQTHCGGWAWTHSPPVTHLPHCHFSLLWHRWRPIKKLWETRRNGDLLTTWSHLTKGR